MFTTVFQKLYTIFTQHNAIVKIQVETLWSRFYLLQAQFEVLFYCIYHRNRPSFQLICSKVDPPSKLDKELERENAKNTASSVFRLEKV